MMDLSSYEIIDQLDSGHWTKIYRVLVNGYLLCMKRLIRGNRKMDHYMESECAIYELLPHHENIVKYIGRHDTLEEICIFTTLYDTTVFNLYVDSSISMENCMIILHQTALAIKHLHETGILHCDIKPDNIFVFMNTQNKIMRVCLGDFDHAQKCSDIVSGEMTGTMGFIAPEVLRNERFSYPADIFSFGMTIYSIIMRCLPYYEYTADDQIADAVRAGITPCITRDLDEYEALIALYEDCVEYEPSERPTVSKIIQRLKELI